MGSSAVGIDLKQASEFLTLMAEGEPVTFQTFDDRGKDRSLATIHHGDLDHCAKELQRLNARGAGVFFTVNYTDGKGRQAENITGIRALFGDLDGAPLQPVIDCGIDPHCIVETSPGKWHAYWLVADVALAQFKPLQQAIARRFGGDPKVCDLPRVMRVPGFIHRKGSPFLSRIVAINAVQPYALADLCERMQLKSIEVRRSSNTQSTSAVATVIEGNRNASLASHAGSMRRKGLSSDAIEAALLVINREQCSPPLDDDEVCSIARSIGRYAPAKNSNQAKQSVAPEATWPEPLLPSTARAPEIEANVLPGWLGEVAAAVSTSTQTPPAMSVMMILAILGAVLQRRFEVSPWGDDYREPLAVWTMVAMPSASRKSAVFSALLDVLVAWEKREGDRMRREINRVFAAREVILKRIEQLKHNAGRTDDAEVRAKLQDEIAAERDSMPAEVFATRIFTGDVTAERLQGMLVEQGERIAIISDEPGIFQNLAGLYSGGMSSLDIYLKGHAGSSVRVDRAGRQAHLDKPAVSMGLAIQPGILTDTGKSKRFRDSGLMARFWYAVPLSNVGRRDIRARTSIDTDVLQRWEDNIGALLTGLRLPIGTPRVLPFAANAREEWLQFAEEIEREQGDGGRFAHMSDWTGKLPGATARIACLMELGSKGLEATNVSASSVKRAVQLARLLIPHAEAAFRLMGAADTESDALALLDWIKRHEFKEFTRRDAQKSLQARFPTLERLMPAIKQLQEWSVLSGELSHRRDRGAPSKYYQVNPRIYVIKSIKP
jgi:replicative DNA helicase